MTRIYGSVSDWDELHEWMKQSKREYVMFLSPRPTDEWERCNIIATFPTRVLPVLKDECIILCIQSQIKAELSL